jgi:hypothetical protein
MEAGWKVYRPEQSLVTEFKRRFGVRDYESRMKGLPPWAKPGDWVQKEIFIVRDYESRMKGLQPWAKPGDWLQEGICYEGLWKQDERFTALSKALWLSSKGDFYCEGLWKQDERFTALSKAWWLSSIGDLLWGIMKAGWKVYSPEQSLVTEFNRGFVWGIMKAGWKVYRPEQNLVTESNKGLCVRDYESVYRPEQSIMTKFNRRFAVRIFKSRMENLS